MAYKGVNPKVRQAECTFLGCELHSIRKTGCVARQNEWCVWKEYHSGSRSLFDAWRGGYQRRFGQRRGCPLRVGEQLEHLVQIFAVHG